VKCPLKIQREDLTIPFLAVVLTDNPSIDPTLHVLALERQSEITILQNVRAMNLNIPGKTNWFNTTGLIITV
jgi:hypothetical protein